MANLGTDGFLHCKVSQYRNGSMQNIDEVISQELPYSFEYVCHYNEETFAGNKQLYAYPDKVDELILGHTILDLLPCYSANFEYELKQENSKYCLKLKASDHKDELAKPIEIAPEKLITIMDKVLKSKGKWDGTGCFHRAALYHPLSEHIIIAEDIGRHNCVDRLKGRSIIEGFDIKDYCLFITARITASLYHKIRRAGIANIVSRSAITSEAYLSATQSNCTLAAFCRPEGKRVTMFS